MDHNSPDLESRPRKPLNAYFKLRQMKFAAEGGDSSTKSQNFKTYWEELSEEDKQMHQN